MRSTSENDLWFQRLKGHVCQFTLLGNVSHRRSLLYSIQTLSTNPSFLYGGSLDLP